jgi:CheY-like chemotaxis protein
MYHGHILLISDGSKLFPDLARFLAQAGYHVTLAFHGREAFQALRRGGSSLVITRFSKEWLDKRPFLDAVGELNQEISLLFLGSGPDEIRLPREAYLMKTTGDRITPCGWRGLRHLVTSLPKSPPAPAPGEAPWQPDRPLPSKVAYLDFRRKCYA